MKDRRLIECAAKACALPECGWMAGTFTYVKDNTFTTWDPLNDDGDNRRLQVDLRLGLIPIEGGAWDVTRYDGESCTESVLSSDIDPKRAIVRAAAALAPTGEGKS